MANDRWYNPGDNYLLDDNTGFKIRASKVRIQWDNIATSGSHFSPRQPQDLVQGVRDDQTVAVNRPRQPNRFTVVATFVTAPAPRGDNVIFVDSTVGFVPGDYCSVMLDEGDPFYFTLASIGAGSLIWSGLGLPGTVGGALGDPLENTVMDITRSRQAPSP